MKLSGIFLAFMLALLAWGAFAVYAMVNGSRHNDYIYLSMGDPVPVVLPPLSGYTWVALHNNRIFLTNIRERVNVTGSGKNTHVELLHAEPESTLRISLEEGTVKVPPALLKVEVEKSMRSKARLILQPTEMPTTFLPLKENTSLSKKVEGIKDGKLITVTENLSVDVHGNCVFIGEELVSDESRCLRLSGGPYFPVPASWLE